MREAAAVAVYTGSHAEDEDVTPRPSRSTDVTKLTLPLPFTITIVGLALAAAAGVWRIESKVATIETSMEYERRLDTERAETIKQRFEAMEAKIDAAGLRNANMSLVQELQKQRGR